MRFAIRYNQREDAQPANFDYPNFGANWACDWLSYITDSPSQPNGDE